MRFEIVHVDADPTVSPAPGAELVTSHGPDGLVRHQWFLEVQDLAELVDLAQRVGHLIISTNPHRLTFHNGYTE